MEERPVAKLAHKCTGILGNSLTGECASIHFQLVSQVTMDEGRKLQLDFFQHIRYTCGKFGHAEAKDFPCTVGINKKGGINEAEFAKYIDSAINDMFPNMEDVLGKCILLKVDSGPGCNCDVMLVNAYFKGLYIYPGLPTAAAVHQETDQSYGLIKLVMGTNLDQIATECHASGKPMTLRMLTFGLIVYGGKCPELDVMCWNAVDLAFNNKSNLNV